MLEVRLIGKFDIQCDGKPVRLSSRAAQSLFAYLILTAGTLHRREKLAGMFWPDKSEEKARAYLRHELWRIRQAFPLPGKVGYLVADDISISFDALSEYRLDVAPLENVNESASIDELKTALSVFQGELLPGFYDDWIILEREHLQAIYEQKITRLLDMFKDEKRWNDIVEWAERWISPGQGLEAAYRYLMSAYAALGDRAKVSSTYERCVKALHDLDLEPSEQTRDLAFRRTHSLNIPIPLTSFIGREKEIKEIADLFTRSRLITLTGSGGVGKTRLAIQIVAEVLNIFPDGIWFLDLAPLSDPALVPSTLIGLLGLRESGELSANDLLINYFHSRKAVVIFDNCEHLIESCAQLVNSLLTSCEILSILTTSREVLRVSGEIPYRVPSLEIPKPDTEFAVNEISNIESVRLFTDRAAVASPGFAIGLHNVLTIAQICQRLDGIPLAIELAAARVNVLTVEQILTRLDDRFNLLTHGLRSSLPRHQTLRATIEWSYHLLLEKEQLLFRRLAVFSGGWTLDAAEEVCSGNGLEAQEILDLLSRLVNKSLVLVETTDAASRYRRLETIRQFARERLIESGELKSIRTRHLKYFLRLSEEAEPALEGPAQMEWNARLYHERDNIRAALQWADQTDVEAGLILSSSLYLFWCSFDFREGKDWLNRFLQKPESSRYAMARADALCMYGAILVDLQQLEELFATAQECLDLYRAVGDGRGEVDGLLLLVSVSSNPTERTELIQQALHLAQLLGDEQRQVEALWKLGWYDSGQSKFIFWEQAIVLARRLGNWRGLAGGLATAAGFLILNGNFESAEKYLEESERLYRQLNIYPPPAGLLTAYGQLASVHGDLVKARAYFEENARIGLQVGSRQDYLWSRVRLGYVALREGNLTEANDCFSEPAQRFQEDKNEGGVAFTLEGMAGLFIALAKPEPAARLIGWADATREKINDTRPLIEQADVDRDIAAIRAQIGQVAFSDQYGRGKNMTLDEAVVCAFGAFNAVKLLSRNRKSDSPKFNRSAIQPEC
jgi:predicted ATPase/DNA-binding SARP family transcriptional activator